MKYVFYRIIYQKKINYFLRYLIYKFFKKNKKLQIPISGIFSIKTNNGNIKIKTNQTSYIAKLLYYNGYKEFEYSVIFEEIIKSCTVFLDIGANFGYYSLLAHASNSKIKTLAFEPATGPKHYLNENINLNNADTIIPIEKALSNSNGIIDFFEVCNSKYPWIRHNLSGEHNAGSKKNSRNFIKKTVNAVTLNQFAIDENLSQLDIIKIDTEGTEIDILKGGITTLKKFKPIVICETLFNNTEDDLESIFKSLGYDFYNHSPEGLFKVLTISRKVDNGIRNCFFVHPSKKHLIESFIF
ncbi:MAG: FkbM family methyltransferase [Patiriisocius sp.]|uniref:FkbM family methyltransferase n=1 Tax=Patiriisocius sp. TaxID=2822396 RepID=UPI003EF10D36